jgi:hypothetical protein
MRTLQGADGANSDRKDSDGYTKYTCQPVSLGLYITNSHGVTHLLLSRIAWDTRRHHAFAGVRLHRD